MSEFTIPTHRLGDEGGIDDQGYLHTNTGGRLTERVVVSTVDTEALR